MLFLRPCLSRARCICRLLGHRVHTVRRHHSKLISPRARCSAITVAAGCVDEEASRHDVHNVDRYERCSRCAGAAPSAGAH